MDVAPLPEELLAPPITAGQVPSLSDEELDAVPFGVIGLTPDGVIARYNLAEARFARLDRSRVVGRRFFDEVAPCTRTDAFQGRFVQFLGTNEPFVRFSYVFDFKFGAQTVDIELVRDPASPLVYVCVNRTRFGGVRGADGLTPAPLLGELVREPDYVLRDTFARRVVRVDGSLFSALRATWDRVAPNGWQVFCEEWGRQWGRRAVVDLEAMCLEETNRSLRDLPIAEAVGRGAQLLEAQGWGRTVADFSAIDRSAAFTITLAWSAHGESVGQSDFPRCHLFAGFYRALFVHLSERLLWVGEACCRSQGAASCAFVVVRADRKQALVSALERGGGDVARVLDLLSEKRP
ncbi:MAG: PAS domain-containing protein [Myxococcaceae bacterium]|nr:PAS domain-containing protein [Myxococcaceae bacterium]